MNRRIAAESATTSDVNSQYQHVTSKSAYKPDKFYAASVHLGERIIAGFQPTWVMRTYKPENFVQVCNFGAKPLGYIGIFDFLVINPRISRNDLVAPARLAPKSLKCES
jgi:hypothetical protein